MEGAGSFVRPTSSKIQLPRSFLAVLKSRYASETGEGREGGGDAPVLLGRSGIEVEQPNLAKVRRRLGRLQGLRELGVDGEGVGRVQKEELEELRAMGEWSESTVSALKGHED